MTNSERLRQLPDEEIAKIAFYHICDERTCEECRKFNNDCEVCVKSWLKEEAKE